MHARLTSQTISNPNTDSENSLDSIDEKAALFQSLVTMAKDPDLYDSSLEMKAVKFLNEIVVKDDEEAGFHVWVGFMPSRRHVPQFVESVKILLSLPNQQLVTASMEFLRSLVVACSPLQKLALVDHGLVSNMMSALKPTTLTFPEADDIHLCLMDIVYHLLWLSTPSGLDRLEFDEPSEQLEVREAVFEEVVGASEGYLFHLCTHHTSLAIAPQSRPDRWISSTCAGFRSLSAARHDDYWVTANLCERHHEWTLFGRCLSTHAFLDRKWGRCEEGDEGRAGRPVLGRLSRNRGTAMLQPDRRDEQRNRASDFGRFPQNEQIVGNECSEQMNASEGCTVTRTEFGTENYGGSTWSSLLLSDPFTSGIISITITLLSLPDIWRDVYFGLMDSNYPIPKVGEELGFNVNNSVGLGSNCNLYNNTPSSHTVHNCHSWLKEGDNVRMEVDLDSTPRTLQFFVNGKAGECYMSGIPSSVRIGFSVKYQGTSFRIDNISRLSHPTPISDRMREIRW
ncbi:hypothetical protein BLNAU_7705 [Blattamonas nauphoetae]|uniref:SPRY domain-containing protein n=1 Tax=Blattamonas nauphoetae TaxID=2049346 RepID=A0ABQ9Y0R6_9EUKA|nr:hypothetical protein BLNAU_7705 [Blattamonas nauphoetae]